MSDDHQDWRQLDAAGATPVADDDREALKLGWVATLADLNIAERDNILSGLRKRRWRNPSTIVLLDDLAVRQLHLHMFGDVWKWAGQYRTREVNIGIAPEKISVAVRALVDDARVWLGESDPVHLARAVCRLHHRLVQIHPFVNGNGRLARAYSDLVLVAMGQPAFTWGRLKAKPLDEVRVEYLSALRQADAGDLKPLEEFVRT